MAYDRRLIIVTRPAIAAAANAAAADLDALGGPQTFTVPLRMVDDPTNATVAYWCSWALTATLATSIRTRLQARGATAAEVTVLAAGTIPTPGQRMYVFDGRESVGWTPAAVLLALALDVIPGPAD